MQAAIFDVDKTLLRGSTGIIFSRLLLLNGFIRLGHFLRISFYVTQYNLNIVNYERAMEKAYIAAQGMNVETIREFMQKHFPKIKRRIYPKMRDIIEEHRKEGRMIVFATNSWRPMVEQIAKELKADHLICTDVKAVSGVYTGDLERVAYGTHKAKHIKEFASKSRIDLCKSYAYSDHISDRHMLALVGNPVAVNPDTKLKRYSKENGWKVMRL